MIPSEVLGRLPPESKKVVWGLALARAEEAAAGGMDPVAFAAGYLLAHADFIDAKERLGGA